MSLTPCASPGARPHCSAPFFLCSDYVLKVFLFLLFKFKKEINPSEDVILNIKVNISDDEMPEDYLIRAKGAGL